MNSTNLSKSNVTKKNNYQQSNVIINVTEFDVIAHLESLGFSVKGKYIYKTSNNGRNKEVCGNFNSNSIYFYASSNIYPFEPGIAYPFNKVVSNNSIVTPEELQRISERRQKEKAKEQTKKVLTAEEYLLTTDDHHNFNLQLLLNSYHKNKVTDLIYVPTLWSNSNQVKGKYGKTYFPLFNAENELNTCQVIAYGSDLKRRRDQNIFYLSAKENIGLYRRNIFDYEKYSIIVESPKLAELGALLIPQLNWFATLGKERLSTLDLSFLDIKKTYLLPDSDGFNLWKEIAITRLNCNIVDVFQEELELKNLQDSKEYSDLADLIVPFLQNKLPNELILSLYRIYTSLVNLSLDDKELLEQVSPEVNSYSTELDFSEKKKKNERFVSCIPKDFTLNTQGANGKGGIYKQSSSGGHSFKTEYIEVFKEKFEVISASFDICKEYTEQEFIENLSKCFRVIRYLNPNDYLRLFDIIISHIHSNGNYNFNQRYIRETLIPELEEIDCLYIDDLIKIRQFSYLGGGNFNNYEFLEEVRKAKKLYDINAQLYAIKGIVEQGINEVKFIDKSQLGISKEAGNEYIFDLINRFNIASVGSNDKRIAEVVKTLVTFNITIYKHHYFFYHVEKSIRDVSKMTNINRVTLSNLLKFNRDIYTINEILEEINYLLDNPNSFNIEKVEYKGKKYNSVVPIFNKKSINIKDLAITSDEAFDYELDLSNSILNCDDQEAYERGTEFLVSWLKFNNDVAVIDISNNSNNYIFKIINEFEEVLTSA